MFFAVVVTLVCTLGLGRVWLSVQAAQASIDSTRLRRDIKLEQYQGAPNPSVGFLVDEIDLSGVGPREP